MTGFDSQVKTLQDDLQSQVDAFDNFTAQEERIRDLEEKVKKGRQRAERLSQRLEAARARLKDVERADAERWARTSRECLCLQAHAMDEVAAGLFASRSRITTDATGQYKFDYES